MSESRLDKSPSHHKEAASALSYPVRRMRNTAVLVKWIEEHQTNPYPTKAEKQYLAYYSGMNLTQLSTWFANARRRIKKIGMKTWLEGRSTFTVDFFPSPTLQAPSIAREYPVAGGSSGYGANPYSYQLPSAVSYATQQQHTASLSPMQVTSQRIPNGAGSSLIYSDASAATAMQQSSTTAGLYGGRSSLPPSMMTIGAMPAFANWAGMPAAPLLPSTSVGLQSRPSCGGSTAPLHSPVTAQVYSADPSHLRTHSGQLLEVNDGTYTPPQQHSPPEHMLPECASSEPMLQDTQKSQSSIPN